MRRSGRLILPARVAALACALAACGGTTPPATPPVPPPDAAVDATVRPTAEECGRALDHLLHLRGWAEPLAEADRTVFIDDCTAHSTAPAVACVLAAPDLNAVALCDQNPPRETP